MAQNQDHGNFFKLGPIYKYELPNLKKSDSLLQFVLPYNSDNNMNSNRKAQPINPLKGENFSTSFYHLKVAKFTKENAPNMPMMKINEDHRYHILIKRLSKKNY
ncbi:hypothetical protein QQ008_05540 [Fulvivirgaceae bacterium BMA10]|uniref:Uncharacterized protein n=2 Tax=Splendidivirga corallicola TaxID=3051826 RepID=A0ABT8KJD5_9BACT|nr:hypothetical protein [Fulvivirgaceae bacterium BMA10]